MTRPKIVDRLRIAIAFCVLEFKPHGQSLTSYMQDLHAIFPRAHATNASDVTWRERVLELEQALADLRAKHNQARIRLFEAQVGRSVPESSISSAAIQSALPTKKRIQRKYIQHTRTDLEAVLNRKHEQVLSSSSYLSRSERQLIGIYAGFFLAKDIPSLPAAQSLFAAFDALKHLAEQPEREGEPHSQLLADATSRALEDLGTYLRSILPPNPPMSSSVEMLKAISTLFSFLTTTILPLFISRLKAKRKATAHGSSVITSVDQILGQLTNLILIPLIRSFGPLSQCYTANIFSAKHAAEGHTTIILDIRSDISCLLRKAMSDLDHPSTFTTGSLVANFRSVEERVALECVREMAKVYPASSSKPNMNTDSASSAITVHTAKISRPLADRIDKLAKKDTLWYMCSVLHLIFSPSLVPISITSRGYESSPSTENHLLEDAMLTGLSSFLRRDYTCTGFSRRSSPNHNTGHDMNGTSTPCQCGSGAENGKLRVKCSCQTVFDDVEYGMILAVVEKAWLYWFGYGADVDECVQL